MLSILINAFKKSPQSWARTILSGVFMFVVLFIYKAYDIQQGISYSGHSLLFRAFSFGLSSSICFYLLEFFFFDRVKSKSLKSYFVLFTLEIFLGTNITFLLFNIFWNWTELLWSAYTLLLFEYTLIMIFPISLSFIFKIDNEKTKDSTPLDDYISFESDNGKDIFSLKTEQLLYIQSADNYVEIHYLSEKEHKQTLLRSSLKKIEEKYALHFTRIHRSFLINPQNIQNIIKNTKGVTIDLGFGIQVPVSKSYQKKLDSFLPHSSSYKNSNNKPVSI
ncbi:LytR/AlgR family response regulator transcription factor [Sediminitomix flava]|uniref:LytTR family transcriptional regulator n=1 Tax=Sediminitomix flava TaxID=379075 RepID=A0A315ZX92_SEDFL|nr:LytTR family DNA-binding domain-containing protein [Sediminitomix flava]PWJ41957.1 LytTR family transcriptional regulator [Sediminitomix flava]